jgi:hypothetical protein
LFSYDITKKQMSVNTTFIKGGVAMGVAVALDMLFLKEPNLQTSLMIGASAGAGSIAGSYLAKMTPALIPDDTSASPAWTGQAVMARAFEVAGSTGAIILLERNMQNLNRQDSIVEVLGISCVAIAIAEVVDDYMNTRPISIFA